MLHALSVLLEAVVTTLLVLFYWVRSVVMVLVPTAWIAKDIRGQTVLITGAGGGLGIQLAERFARLGCKLVLWDINAKLNEAAAEVVRSTGAEVRTYTIDLCSRDQIYATAKQVLKDVGQVDILINNAGVVSGKPCLEADDNKMELTVRVNTLANFWMIKAFLPEMLRRRSGHVVTIASSAGLLGVPGMTDYCASKFGIVGFDEALRLELAKSRDSRDVKTTCICPFLIKTDMFRGCSARFPLLLDALDPEYVADQVIRGIQRNQELVYLPRMIYVLVLLKHLLPANCLHLAANFIGASTMMDSFVGRQGIGNEVKVNDQVENGVKVNDQAENGVKVNDQGENGVRKGAAEVVKDEKNNSLEGKDRPGCEDGKEEEEEEVAVEVNHEGKDKDA